MREFCRQSVSAKERVSWEGHTVNMSRLELSCRYTMSKEQVNFSKGPVLGFGQSEPTPYIAEQIGARVEEGRLGSPIPRYSRSDLP